LRKNENKKNVDDFVNIFLLVPLGVEINPQFYWGKIKALAYANKTSSDIIVNGLATALLKYQGGFKQC